MRLIIVMLLSLFILSCQSKVKIRGKDSFANLYIEGLQKANPDISFVLNSDLSIICKKGDREVKHYIDNAYKTYQNDPASIEEIINLYASASFEFLGDRKTGIESVVPMINNVALIEANKLKGRLPDSIVFETYNDELIIVYSEALENTFHALSKERFKSLGVPLDTLRQIAVGNLDSIAPIINREGDDGTYSIDAGGGIESSLILLKSFWSKENLPVDGEFIVAIPTKNSLYVTGSNNRAQIRRFRLKASEEFRRGPFSVSDRLFKWTGKKFELFE